MWGKYKLERKLADAMGYDYCTLFDTARSALRAWREAEKVNHRYPPIPSNVCPQLREVLGGVPLVPVNPLTGMAPGIAVQIYGYRNIVVNGVLEIDPLMTGFLRGPLCRNSIISFGRKKMLIAEAGGALLSNEKFKGRGYFPEAFREELTLRLMSFPNHISRQHSLIDYWDRLLGDSCIRIPQEQIMPWRVMRRIPEKRDAVVKALRKAGHAVGTNYPPLPGVKDAGAIQWGNEVINFFPDDHDIRGACEIVKGVMDDGYHS